VSERRERERDREREDILLSIGKSGLETNGYGEDRVRSRGLVVHVG
jgi:hypothetical protein